MKSRLLAISLLLALAPLGGCAQPAAQPPRSSTINLTAQPAPALLGRRVSTLLNFDSPPDMVFIESDPHASATAGGKLARSGGASLRLPSHVNSVTVKVPPLMEGRPFPADWTLLGAYVHSDRAIYVAASYEVAGKALLARTVGVSAGGWTPVMLDLAALPADSRSEIGVLRLRFNPTTGATVHVDDVILVDNHDTVVSVTSPGGAWSIKRRGLFYLLESPGRYAFKLATAQAEQSGWSVVESSRARARFASSGRPGSMTIYADGRMYWGGEFRAISPNVRDAAELAAQHATPAEVTVVESLGRLNRATPGDADNDGYNEARGAYQLVAHGARVELELSPRSAVLSRAVLEISGLPPGPLLVHMEGRLVQGAVRLSNGDVLVELPGRLQRPTLVNVRVQ